MSKLDTFNDWPSQVKLNGTCQKMFRALTTERKIARCTFDVNKARLLIMASPTMRDTEQSRARTSCGFSREAGSRDRKKPLT
jgi:hypothetical protein